MIDIVPNTRKHRMVRTRKSHEPGEEKPKTRRGLEAYSPKVDGHRYVIYASYAREGDPVEKILDLKFLGTFAARFMVTRLIGKDDWKYETWFDRDTMVVTSRGVKIRAHADQIKELIDYEPTEEEDAWRDELLIASINRFLYGRSESGHTDPVEDIRDEDDDGEDTPKRARDPKPARAAKPERPKADPKPKRERVDLSGMVTANDIAKKLGVEGREVRGVLRAMKLEKPSFGWAFDKKTAADIEAKVTAGLKAAKKKKGK